MKRRDFLDIALVLTLILLMFETSPAWQIAIPLRVLGIVGLIFKSLRYRRILWGTVTLILGLGFIPFWHLLQNNQFLIFFWCLALTVAMGRSDFKEMLRHNAHLIIGTAFLFAVGHKLLSQDYVNGAFFHYALLTDERFSDVAALLGRAPYEVIKMNFDKLTNLASKGSVELIELQGDARLLFLAKSLTWWTVILEASIAIIFLLPQHMRFTQWRDMPLLLFLFSTYTVATVVPFGWMLAILGLVQCRSNLKLMPWLYVVGFIVVEFYRIPFLDILNISFPHI